MRQGVYDEALTIAMNNLLLKYDYDLIMEFLYNEDSEAFHDNAVALLR